MTSAELRISSPIGSTVVTLGNGCDMPYVGLGTYQLHSKPGEVAAAVEAAIDVGYRHIDCAFAYGNEKEIGKALKKKFDEGLKREEVFITSKLWNTKHRAEDVRAALEQTLKDLQLEYLDLYLIHWPFGWKAGEELFPKDEAGSIAYSDVHFTETWPEMEKAVDNGLAKSIGLSNFNSKQVSEICNMARIQPTVLQCECHPYLTQKELIAHCKNLNIVFTAYRPLGSPGRPWAKDGEPLLLEDPKLVAIGKKYNKTPAQICIKFQIQRDVVVVPKSYHADRIKQNSDIFDFEMTEDEMKEIESFNRPWRSCVPKIKNKNGVVITRDERHHLFPFKEPF